MKRLIALFTISVFAALGYAQDDAYEVPTEATEDTSSAEEVDEVFGSGTETEEFQFERFSNESILLEIDKDAKVNCNSKGLCTMSSITENNNEFSVSFEVGKGLNSNDYGYGYTDTNNNNNSNSTNNGDKVGWSVNLRYKYGRCTQEVEVPRSLYYSVNRYLYGLMKEDGSPKRKLTPADQQMLLFYTTIMGKATGCGGS